MASEIARLQKDADADRAIEVNRAIAEARQIKETLDVNMAGLELSVHERLQDSQVVNYVRCLMLLCGVQAAGLISCDLGRLSEFAASEYPDEIHCAQVRIVRTE